MENLPINLAPFAVDYNQSVNSLLGLTPYNNAEEVKTAELENEAKAIQYPIVSAQNDGESSEESQEQQPIANVIAQPTEFGLKQPSCPIPILPQPLNTILQDEQESPKIHNIFSRTSSVNRPLDNYSGMARENSAFQIFSLEDGGIPKGWSTISQNFAMSRQPTIQNEANKLMTSSPILDTKKEEVEKDTNDVLRNMLASQYFSGSSPANPVKSVSKYPGTILFDSDRKTDK